MNPKFIAKALVAGVGLVLMVGLIIAMKNAISRVRNPIATMNGRNMQTLRNPTGASGVSTMSAAFTPPGTGTVDLMALQLASDGKFSGRDRRSIKRAQKQF